MRNLVITGFMGTGKSTVGRLLAERCGLSFVDTDAVVERDAGRTVAEIFAAEGEARFRQLEHQALESTLMAESQVIATGGGALLAEESRALLRVDDLVLCLTCAPEVIRERLGVSGHRPLLPTPDVAAIRELLDRRAPVYGSFEQIDTSNLAADEVAASIAGRHNLAIASTLAMEQRRDSRLMFEQGLASRADALVPLLPDLEQVVVVTDDNVWAAGLVDPLLQSMRSAVQHVHHVVLPAGESSKSLCCLEILYRTCAEHRLERTAAIVGMGGGMVCDVAALAAATYLRGLRLVLVPTSLLAQVDAAIGGKAAIDLDGAKNLIGAFYPADVVVLDPEVLRTLPPARLAEGLAEVVKVAVMRSASLFESVESLDAPQRVLHESHIIRRAAIEKVRVVQEDPFEHGVRALLNFGHTVGHGLEAASAYALSHGEAVSAGMIAETRLSERLGLCGEEVLPRLRNVLDHLGLPHAVPGLDVGAVMDYIKQDKKRRSGRLRFALPRIVGEGTVVAADKDDVAWAVRAAVGDGS